MSAVFQCARCACFFAFAVSGVSRGSKLTTTISKSLPGVNGSALRADESVDCWGQNDFGQAEEQTGPYTYVSAGSGHACALRPDGSADCWGENSSGEADDQPGPYGPYEPGNTTYTFTGFFSPVANPPAVNRLKAGQVIAINFSLDGDFGLGVYDDGYPVSRAVNCVTLTPIGPDTLEWTITFDDPHTWSRPWTFAMNLTHDESQAPFEYACHEGNYGLRNILSVARAEERMRATAIEQAKPR